MLTYFLEIDIGDGLNCAKLYSNDLFFSFGDRASTSLNLDKCMLQLQSWQPTITFHNFVKRGGRENTFW